MELNFAYWCKDIFFQFVKRKIFRLVKNQFVKRMMIAVSILWLYFFVVGNALTLNANSPSICGLKQISYIFLNFKCLYLFNQFAPELHICEEWEGFFRRSDCSHIDDEQGMRYFDDNTPIYLEDGSVFGGTGRCSRWRNKNECEKGNPAYIFEHTLKKVYYDVGIVLEFNETVWNTPEIAGAKIIKEEGGDACRKKTIKDLTCSELIYELKCYGKPHKICPNILVNEFN